MEVVWGRSGIVRGSFRDRSVTVRGLFGVVPGSFRGRSGLVRSSRSAVVRGSFEIFSTFFEFFSKKN